jgi:hypothetical protein
VSKTPTCSQFLLRGQTARRHVLTGALLACLSPVLAQAPLPSNEPGDFLHEPPKPASIKGNFTLVAIGDLLYSHPLADSGDIELQKVFQLTRSGDLTIGNREGTFFDLKTFAGSPYGDGLLWGEAALGRDMKAIGVGMVSVANNHATDWGWQGLRESLHLLDEAGIAYAGGGRDLTAAREAGFVETPKGRVGLISTASTFKPNAGANDSLDDVPGRPGISILRTRTIHLVTAEQLAMIRRLAVERATPLEPPPATKATEVEFGGQQYRLADKPGLHYEMDLYDEAGLLKAIHDAKQQSDLVIFTIHAHESASGVDDDTPEPPDFLVKLFHEAVDAGADEIIGGGPHSLRGIEIYKGRLVLYGIGAFFIRGEIKAPAENVFHVYPDASGHAPPPKPPERSVRSGGNPASWYDGLVASTEFEGGRIKVVRIYPLDTGNTYEPARRGIPHLADPVYANRILTYLQQASAQFGTRISIEGSVGVIRIP